MLVDAPDEHSFYDFTHYREKAYGTIRLQTEVAFLPGFGQSDVCWPSYVAKPYFLCMATAPKLLKRRSLRLQRSKANRKYEKSCKGPNPIGRDVSEICETRYFHSVKMSVVGSRDWGVVDH
ncbi:hypothetical protein EVAR_90375_1 [Eumeta japonica]|uniref:Uncharacterized protein n=1 Tax=Eumeta variegata TaxID=151549 RepID=A0A4C1YBE0_EUMVA|nr:hypothetical protein EVAR_90375_1 [Eumeta japonica]